MHNKIVHAPLKDPSMVIDVGCGTGIVTRHLGTQYPSATVYGVDLSPVPPFVSTPANVSYIEGDIRKLMKSDERLTPASLDYIYQRLLICGMTNWDSYIKDMATLLQPGGWIEVHDYAEIWYKNGEVCSGDWKWQKAMREGARQLGLDLDCGLNAQQYMKNAGLVDVEVHRYTIPYGTWLADEKPESKRIGEHQDRDMGPVFSQHVLPGVTRGLGLSDGELADLQSECSKTLAGEKGKYCYFYVTVGRKA